MAEKIDIGVPIDEIFTNHELNHLRFERWRQQQTPDDHTPGEVLPDAIQQLEGQEVGKKKPHAGDFFEQRRRREKGWK